MNVEKCNFILLVSNFKKTSYCINIYKDVVLCII